MIWLILFNFLIWLLLFLILTEDRWMKILFAVILVAGIVYFFWAKPDFAFADPRRAKIVSAICDVIGFLLIYPKLKDNKEE